MNLPEPIKTNITDESFAGITYHIRGVLVPELVWRGPGGHRPRHRLYGMEASGSIG